jgi:hypothetical protein
MQFAAPSCVASRAYVVSLDEHSHHFGLAAFDGGEQRPQLLLLRLRVGLALADDLCIIVRVATFAL